MSAKQQTAKAAKRRYEKRERARKEAETRLRITQAAVDLHGTVGPACTTIAAIADRAGVQRATVYRHFPSEDTLFQACSSHWVAANPPPDPTTWRRIPDPYERLRTALPEVYRYYRAAEAMLANVTRDEPLVPALARPATARRAHLDFAADVLIAGRRERGHARRRAAVMIRHGLEFETWRSLARDRGLSDQEAAELMATATDAVAAATPAANGRG